MQLFEHPADVLACSSAVAISNAMESDASLSLTLGIQIATAERAMARVAA